MLKSFYFLFKKIGTGGAEKCNHVGGLLFAISDFQERGLKSNPEKLACTSKLNGWVVPRNLSVPPKPIDDIKIRKIKYGKTGKNIKTVNTYDPRATQDRAMDHHALDQLYNSLKECVPSSAFFFHHGSGLCRFLR